MSELIDALPGVALPVSEVTQQLAAMWADSFMEFRASQMNVVLHFGLDVSFEEAHDRFECLLNFSRRYPCRIIVLCPRREAGDGSMQAKLFSQCYIGESQREMCCCEALLLSYKSEDYGHLSNQVSVWLETDLPTYHWFSGVPTRRIRRYYDNLLVGVRRAIYDSSIESEDLSAIDWPNAARVRDLAYARLLPVRQVVGQFMSGYSMQELCCGLESVKVTYCSEMSGEGRGILNWVRECLSSCFECSECAALKASYELEACHNLDSPDSLRLEFKYSDERYFTWRKFKEGSLGEIEAYLGKVQQTIPTLVKPLSPEQALSEALFF
jgi:hypothetical protein